LKWRLVLYRFTEWEKTDQYRLEIILKVSFTEITTGRYNSVSEVIRSALRLLEVEEKKTNELRKALDQGEKSKMAGDFNPTTHLKNLHRKNL